MKLRPYETAIIKASNNNKETKAQPHYNNPLIVINTKTNPKFKLLKNKAL